MSTAKEKGITTILKEQLTMNIREYTMFIALVAIALIFTVLTNGVFFTPRNLSNLFLQTVTIAILTCGMVLVMVAGHIDLSVGFLAGFTGAIAALLEVTFKLPTPVAIIGAMAAGILVGLWQGYWIAYKHVPAFIVTLAGMLIFKGALIAVTNGQTIGPVSDFFKAIGQGYMPSMGITTAVHDTTLILGVIFIVGYVLFELKHRADKMKYGFTVLPMNVQILKMVLVSCLIGGVFLIMILNKGIPYSIVLLIFLILLFTYVTNKTAFGRHVFAIGGNKEAAKLSGININQRTLIIFVIMGFLSAVAGIVFTGRLNSASASAGNLFELDTIAACVIGGTSTLGGKGTIIGAIVGALVMATLNNGMSLMNVDSQYQFIVKGLILLLAVWVDISSRKNAH